MKKHEIYAWYFPNWHVDARNVEWHGEGWTEWEVVKCARPRFAGHKQPQVPIWGYGDESDPRVMEHKIDAAKKAGIDGFLWDMYWFEDGPYRLDALEKGFFGAKNSDDFKIALMWCNHDPIYAHPATPRHRHDPLMVGDMTYEGFLRFSDYCIERVFPRKNYIRVDGKLYFVFWDLPKFVRNFGGTRGARRVIDDFRNRVREAGLGEMYIATIFYLCPGYFEGDRETCNSFLRELGIDGAVRYGTNCEDKSFPEYPYVDFMNDVTSAFASDTAFLDIPTEITVTNGWDSSPRTLQSDTYRKLGFPYCPVTTGKNPDIFRAALQKARDFMESDAFTGHFLTIATFNEWTEGNHIEPDAEYGTGYLDAIAEVFLD